MEKQKPLTIPQVERSSVWLSDNDIQNAKHVATVNEFNHRSRLKIMSTHNGDYFYELKKDPETQALVATLLKGIIPICDIKRVKTNDVYKYYSYVVPIENEKETGNQTNEIIAYSDITSLLFLDGEHYITSDGHLKNLRLDEDSNAIFFDFDMARIGKVLAKKRCLGNTQTHKRNYTSCLTYH